MPWRLRMLGNPALVICASLTLLGTATVAAAAPVAARPLAVRVQWGGGQPQAWSGRIAVVGSGTTTPPPTLRWRTLCLERDAAAMVHDEGATILVHQPRPVSFDGVEIDVADPRGLRLLVELGPGRLGSTTATIDVPLCDLLLEPVQRTLDGEGNRLTAKLAPGESLRLAIDRVDDPDGARESVPRPGDRLRFTVDPLLPVKPDNAAAVELRMRLTAPARAADIAVQSTALAPLAGTAIDGVAADRWMRFEPVVFDVTLPGEEGVYDVVLEAVERGSLRWTRTVGSRTVQVPAVAAVSPRPPADVDWRVIHELDPGSPKLHERLRRLPGVGLGDVPLPSMSLPSMPLPSFSRPSMPLPRLSSVPGLSAVPALPAALPAISSMVPRLGGLLATGHSRVEPHPLGPMLKLPAATSATVPPWEAIVIAGVEPGAPHAVEIDFPTDQDATIGVTVLETDASGAAVQQRHEGGFEVRRGGNAAVPPRLATHRFVFWPTTRHPLLVVANPRRDATALFGRVRVFAGPERLPSAAVERPAGRGRHAFLPHPDFRGFGGPDRALRGNGPAIVDWGTHLTAIRHASDLLRAHAASGALVTVLSRGAALWPSRHTREAARWDAGRVGDAGLDIAGKDILALLCRVWGREGQRVVPALSFDAPLPELEAILARGGAEATGVASVGRDGRAFWLEGGGTHYNMLDPRVQRVVEAIVVELTERLRDAPTVDGVALLVPHDGWLHVPGTASALDDATFARFLEATAADRVAGTMAPEVVAVAAAEPTDGGRFAARAALVLGVLRDEWLAWRAAELARFHARLAAIVMNKAVTSADGGRGEDASAAAVGNARSLWIVPTTLLVDGAAAERFRPMLGGEQGDDVLLELGFDPVLLTKHPHVVFVAPHVGGATGFSERGMLVEANRAGATAAAAARRRGVAMLERERPLSVAAVVPHGPFGTATAAGSWVMHAVATGDDADGALADALALADAERVFDMGLTHALPAAVPQPRLEWAALPPESLEPLADVPSVPPVVVRTARGEAATWVQVVNPVAAPARVELSLEAAASRGAASRGGAPQPPEPAGRVTVEVGARSLRAVRLDSPRTVVEVGVSYDGVVQEAMTARVGRLRRLRAMLESPVPITVLDNPDFELGGTGGATPAAVPGWELLEPRRGSLVTVPGIAAAGSRAIAFSSLHGLATLRSNPFTSPASGRISVAAWLRVRDGDPQPPLRLALEGVRDDREYYRFAAVGGLAGGRPLTGEWSQFVLQVDDLPENGLDALRVRFDLLGPGTVEIDEVRVFDLAFDERQRAELSRIVALLEQRLGGADVGGCLTGLDGYWPRYLEAFVPDSAARPVATPNAARSRTGVMDRVRRLWQ